MTKKLCRSIVDKKLCGVCGGLAEYFDIDPIIPRLGFVFATCFVGGGVLAYIIMALLMPRAEENVQ